jgi:glyoxylase-like metal-dependent hydrolase (beta-lactamase superfamily II)
VTAEGLVVDPPRDIKQFLAAAADRRIRLTHSLETHLHADFVSGSRELAAAGAQILVPRDARLAFGHMPLDDGEDVDLSGLQIRPIATPGHTPEHLGYLLLDRDRPVGLFSGGALLPGGVARTDLIAPEETRPLARALYRALQERILVLPDDLPVYPTHGAGSFCSTPSGGERTTTIGPSERLTGARGDSAAGASVHRLPRVHRRRSLPTAYRRQLSPVWTRAVSCLATRLAADAAARISRVLRVVIGTFLHELPGRRLRERHV